MEECDFEQLSEVFNDFDQTNFLKEYQKNADHFLIEERYSLSFFLLNNDVDLYNNGIDVVINFLKQELSFFEKNNLVPPIYFNSLFFSIFHDCISYSIDLPEKFEENTIKSNIKTFFSIYNKFINFPIIKDNDYFKQKIDYLFLKSSFDCGAMDYDHEKYFIEELNKIDVSNIFNNFLNFILDGDYIIENNIFEVLIKGCKDNIKIDEAFFNKNISKLRKNELIANFLEEKENENLNKKIKNILNEEIITKENKNKRKI